MRPLILILVSASMQIGSILPAFSGAQQDGGCIEGNPFPQRDSGQWEEGIQNPKLLRRSTPKYTKEAKKAGVEGRVALQFLVRKDGRSSDFKILESLGYGLDERAIETIRRKWKFRPGTKDGTPIDIRTVVELTFKLGAIREVELAHFGRRPFPMRLYLGEPCQIQLVQIEDDVVGKVIEATLRLTGVQGDQFVLEIESGGKSESKTGLRGAQMPSFGLPEVERDYDLDVREVGSDFIAGDLRVPLDSPFPAQVVEPVITHRTPVPYTPGALEAKLEGEVELQFVVREDGSTGRFMVLQYLEHGLDEQAIQEISTNWTFQPGTVDGQPRQFLTRLGVEFKLP